jgi:murein DD-endopeptidase MepM/ murein hydrolase activator NlpD
VSVVAAVLVPPAVPSAALAERWRRPVSGEVARTFSYSRASPFTAGAHRGVDLAAPPGAAVRAACGGHVVHAGPVAGRTLVVSVRCGARRVSYLPLASVAVRAGERVLPGARLGTLGAGHGGLHLGGLHLGVRAERDPFGYVDPLPLLARDRPIAPLARPARPGRPAPQPVPARRAAPRPHPVPARRAAPRPLSGAPALRAAPLPHAAPPRAGVAPWPVWAGLTFLLAGTAGSGTIAVRRRRRAQREVRTVGWPA